MSDIISVLYGKKKMIRIENVNENCFFIVALKGFVNYLVDGENTTAPYTSSH
jgi:hypothetical protein